MADKNDIGLQKAIQVAGTGERLAADLGITPQAISQWEKVPLNRVLDVERVTGIPRSELRPDFFSDLPPPSKAEVAS